MSGRGGGLETRRCDSLAINAQRPTPNVQRPTQKSAPLGVKRFFNPGSTLPAAKSQTRPRPAHDRKALFPFAYHDRFQHRYISLLTLRWLGLRRCANRDSLERKAFGNPTN